MNLFNLIAGLSPLIIVGTDRCLTYGPFNDFTYATNETISGLVTPSPPFVTLIGISSRN